MWSLLLVLCSSRLSILDIISISKSGSYSFWDTVYSWEVLVESCSVARIVNPYGSTCYNRVFVVVFQASFISSIKGWSILSFLCGFCVGVPAFSFWIGIPTFLLWLIFKLFVFITWVLVESCVLLFATVFSFILW